MKQLWQRISAAIKKIFTHEGQLRPYILPAATFLCLLAVVGLGAVNLVDAFRAYSYNQTEITQNETELGITKMDMPKGITNIALFGIDSREDNFEGLSDSIMIITIDAVHNDIKLTSVMRDSLVKVEGHGHQKINAAYSLGGPELAIKTLNQTFDLNIRDYATVDFVSMAGIVDAVGGIEAELTNSEVRQANQHLYWMNIERGTAYDKIEKAGLQTLNGVQAVAFARIRKTATVNGTNDDAGRTERQRLVMRQLFDKALKMDVANYPNMIKALLPCMETSLTYNKIFELAGILTSSGVTLKEARIPANEAIIKHGLNVQYLGSCMYYNLDYAADMLNAFIFADTSFEEYMEANGVDRTPWFTGKVIEEQAQAVQQPEVQAEAEQGGEQADGSEQT